MATETKEGSLKANGFTIDEGLLDILKSYRLQNEKSHTAVPEDHPTLQRQERIKPHVKSLDNIVKQHLGSAPRFDVNHDEKKAESILKELAYTLAQTKEYKGKPEDFNDEMVRDYLAQVATATDNPIFRNKTALVRSILDLPFANPDNDQYDKNSPLAQLINYIAILKDNPSKESGQVSSGKLNYIKQVLAEKWNTMGKDGKAIPNAFQALTGVDLKPYATGGEAFAEVERQGNYQLQGLVAKLPKTYTATPETNGKVISMDEYRKRKSNPAPYEMKRAA